MVVKERVIYNEEVKQRFLDTLTSDSVYHFCEGLFKRTGETEDGLGKDLYDMTLEDIGEVLMGMASGSATSVYNSLAKIEEYIEWSTINGYRQSNIQINQNVDKVKWSRQFVTSYKNYYYTKGEIINLMTDLVNEVDQALLLAIFEGIAGRGFSEILNLKASDIHEEDGKYTVDLHDTHRDIKRTLEISEILAKTLINANKQTEYINKNGDVVADAKYEVSELEDSPFIFKRSVRGKQGGGIDKNFVTRKFLIYKRVFGTEHIKAKHLEDSGVMHMANELQDMHVLTSENMIKIAEHYDKPFTSGIRNDEHIRYRSTTSVKAIVQNDEFEELYGYKMIF